MLKTSLTEEDIFIKLVLRGRCADISYYFSVENHNWEQGIVIFTRLDCDPAPSFKVGVAGSYLIVSKTYQREVESWLAEWNVSCELMREMEFASPEDAREFLANTRQKFFIDEERKEIGIRVKRAIAEHNRALDSALLSGR